MSGVTFFGIDVFTLGLNLVANTSLYLIISLSLNFELGFAGIPNFGKAMFVAAGASVGGAFAGWFASSYFSVGYGKFVSNNSAVAAQLSSMLGHNMGVSIALLLSSVIAGALVSGLLGYIVSRVAIRLREVYLAMTFFAFAQFFQLFVENYTPLAGGQLGIYVPDPYAWAGDNRFVVASLAILLFAVAAFIFFQRMTQSPLGRALRSVRDNEVAASALGKDIAAMKTKVLVISSMAAGIAGALYGFYSGDVLGASFDSTLWTFWPWVIVVIGGLASNYGVVAGTILFWSILDSVDLGKFSLSGVVPFQIDYLEYILIGILLIIILRTRPYGIIKENVSVRVSPDLVPKSEQPIEREDIVSEKTTSNNPNIDEKK
jgi:branched-chain amino acid transport system permease protein